VLDTQFSIQQHSSDATRYFPRAWLCGNGFQDLLQKEEKQILQHMAENERVKTLACFRTEDGSSIEGIATSFHLRDGQDAVGYNVLVKFGEILETTYALPKGYLLKRAEATLSSNKWQQRYFRARKVLHSDRPSEYVLDYFTNETSYVVKGTISIKEARVSLHFNPLVFVLFGTDGGNRSVFLKASSPSERWNWFEALKKIIGENQLKRSPETDISPSLTQERADSGRSGGQQSFAVSNLAKMALRKFNRNSSRVKGGRRGSYTLARPNDFGEFFTVQIISGKDLKPGSENSPIRVKTNLISNGGWSEELGECEMGYGSDPVFSNPEPQLAKSRKLYNILEHVALPAGESLLDLSLKIQIYEVLLLRDSLIGEISYRLKQIPDGQPVEQWHQLQPTDKSRGAIKTHVYYEKKQYKAVKSAEASLASSSSLSSLPYSNGGKEKKKGDKNPAPQTKKEEMVLNPATQTKKKEMDHNASSALQTLNELFKFIPQTATPSDMKTETPNVLRKDQVPSQTNGDDKTRRLKQLEEDIERLDGFNVETEKNLESVRMELFLTTTELETHKVRLKDANTMLLQLKKEKIEVIFGSLFNNLCISGNAERSQAQNQKRNQESEMKRRLRAAKRLFDREKNGREEAERLLDNFRKSISENQKPSSDKEIIESRRELEELRSKRDTLQAELNLIYEKLKKENKDFRAATNDLEKENEALRTSVLELQSEINVYPNEIGGTRKNIQATHKAEDNEAKTKERLRFRRKSSIRLHRRRSSTAPNYLDEGAVVDLANSTIKNAIESKGAPSEIEQVDTESKTQLQICSLHDDKLDSSIYYIILLWAMNFTVDWRFVTPGKSMEQKLSNARYAITTARKSGITGFFNPEDLTNMRHGRILVFLRSILALQRDGLLESKTRHLSFGGSVREIFDSRRQSVLTVTEPGEAGGRTSYGDSISSFSKLPSEISLLDVGFRMPDQNVVQESDGLRSPVNLLIKTPTISPRGSAFGHHRTDSLLSEDSSN